MQDSIQKTPEKHPRYAIGKGYEELGTRSKKAQAKKAVMLQMKFTDKQAFYKVLRGETRLYVHDYDKIQSIFFKLGISDPWGFSEPKPEED